MFGEELVHVALDERGFSGSQLPDNQHLEQLLEDLKQDLLLSTGNQLGRLNPPTLLQRNERRDSLIPWLWLGASLSGGNSLWIFSNCDLEEQLPPRRPEGVPRDDVRRGLCRVFRHPEGTRDYFVVHSVPQCYRRQLAQSCLTLPAVFNSLPPSSAEWGNPDSRVAHHSEATRAPTAPSPLVCVQGHRHTLKYKPEQNWLMSDDDITDEKRKRKVLCDTGGFVFLL